MINSPFKSVKTQDIVVWYTRDHLTLEQIGKLTGMTRQGVYKRLKTVGIKREQGTWVEVNCAFCGVGFRKRRASWRKVEKSYCNEACYHAALENSGYKPWRQGQRLARALVSQYFSIPEGAIVHHKDDDDRNNDKANLQVLASQGDHVRVHRTSKEVEVLWDGASPRSLG